jgi:hypothetical protein
LIHDANVFDYRQQLIGRLLKENGIVKRELTRSGRADEHAAPNTFTITERSRDEGADA